jgi:hypothetical protein
MKNWKTNLFGLVAAIAGFIVFSPGLFSKWPWVGEVAKYFMAGGMAGIGFAAKDSTTHSTGIEVQESSIQANVASAAAAKKAGI